MPVWILVERDRIRKRGIRYGQGIINGRERRERICRVSEAFRGCLRNGDRVVAASDGNVAGADYRR